MMVLQLVIYCLIFTLMVRYAVRGGAVDGLYFYPKPVQERAIEIGLARGIRIPSPFVESIMGKGNCRIMDTLYKGVSLRSIGNACLSVYKYEMKETIREYKKPIVFWHGSNEPYPEKSVRLLKRYLPQLEERVFDNMGHGQMLNEHPSEYAKLVLDFMR